MDGQRNWGATIVRLAIFLAGLAAIGLIIWWVIDRASGDDTPAEQTSSAQTEARDTADDAEDEAEDQIDDILEAAEDDESEEGDEADGSDRVATTGRTPNTGPSGDLPNTGPMDTAAGFMTLPAAGYGAVHYVRSRRALKTPR